MPWTETNPVLERHHFAHDFDSGHWTMTELCLRYGAVSSEGRNASVMIFASNEREIRWSGNGQATRSG